MQCFNKVVTVLWWGPSAVRHIPNEGTKKKNKYAVLWTKRVEKSYSRPPQFLVNYKAVRPLGGDAVGSKWQGTVTMPVMYSELLVTTAVQQTQKQ